MSRSDRISSMEREMNSLRAERTLGKGLEVMGTAGLRWVEAGFIRFLRRMAGTAGYAEQAFKQPCYL
jgi:hypothetical protein